MGPSFSVGCECISSAAQFKPSPISILNPNLIQAKLSEINPRFNSFNVSSNKDDVSYINGKDSTNSSPCKLSFRDFVIEKFLGKGATGKVLLVSNKKKPNKYYAMKIIRKSDVYSANLASKIKLEKQVLQKSVNPFIVKLNYSFQSPTKIYLVMEYLSGGDLFHLLRQKKRFSLNAARFYLAEIVLSLQYLHQDLKLIYRDLKPENILLTSEGHIKITDFGLAKNSDEKCISFVGTPEYVAPEILLNQEQGVSVDYWSCGVLLYEMLAGFSPFMSEKKDNIEIQRKILRREIKFPKYFNEETKDLIEKLLVLNPLERITVEDMKKHKFFEGIDWEKVKNLVYQTPFKMAMEKINNKERKELKESYDLNSLPDLEGFSYAIDEKF